jgi:hypothetical protein
MAAANSSRALLPVLALAGVVFFLLAPAAADAAAPQGLEFHVGGPRGWRVPDANTSYGWWAMNNRFRVGDHLCEYPKCSHPDGNPCNLFNPDLRLSTAVVDGICLSVCVMI